MVQPGLEPLLADEVRARGLQPSVEPGAIVFEAPLALAVEAVPWLRSATRVLVEVASGPVRTIDDLTALVRQAPWAALIHRDDPVEVKLSATKTRLNHEGRVQRHVTPALQLALRRAPLRPPVPQRLLVRIQGETAWLQLDTDGEPLYQRGWRAEQGKASLRESLAAAMLLAAGFQGDEPLVDPMCGSGTLCIEGAFIATGRSPVTRPLACQSWQGAPRPPQALGMARPPLPIVGSDREARAIGQAEGNALRAQVDVTWRHLDLRDATPPSPEPGLLATNPPYGRRLGQDVLGVYKTLGQLLRGPFQGWRSVFVTPDEALARAVDRRVTKVTSFSNGGLRVGLYRTQA